MNLQKDRNKEQELIVRLIAGDENAFCDLYANYKNRLVYFALKFLKSQEIAEDLFQDVFTIIWKNRNAINPNESFSSYVYTITRNLVLNQLRNISNENELKEKILANAIDGNNNTTENILANDLQKHITYAIALLTPRQQEIFKMSREEQMSNKEIAKELGLSVNTVQEHITTSLKTIRNYLSKYTGIYTDIALILACININ